MVPSTPGGPKLIGVNLTDNTIFTTILFPPTVAYPDSVNPPFPPSSSTHSLTPPVPQRHPLRPPPTPHPLRPRSRLRHRLVDRRPQRPHNHRPRRRHLLAPPRRPPRRPPPAATRPLRLGRSRLLHPRPWPAHLVHLLWRRWDRAVCGWGNALLERGGGEVFV